MATIERPRPDEHPDYLSDYIARAPAGDLLAHLRRQIDDTCRPLEALTEVRAAFRYAPGKWSIKQVVGHLTDAERVFAHRALAIARRDPGDQPGMEQDDWMAAADFDRRSITSLCDELRAVRAATCALLGTFDPEVAARRGRASGAEVSVRSVIYALAGHELHHVDVLRERYRIGG